MLEVLRRPSELDPVRLEARVVVEGLGQELGGPSTVLLSRVRRVKHRGQRLAGTPEIVVAVGPQELSLGLLFEDLRGHLLGELGRDLRDLGVRIHRPQQRRVVPIEHRLDTPDAGNGDAAVGHDHVGGEHRGDGHGALADQRESPAPNPLALALPQLVEPDAQEAGDELELGVGAAVRVRPYIGRQRLGALGRQLAVSVQATADGVGKALEGGLVRAISGVRLAIDDETENPVFAAQPLERQDFFVHPSRHRRPRGADDDQRPRLLERVHDVVAEIRGPGSSSRSLNTG